MTNAIYAVFKSKSLASNFYNKCKNADIYVNMQNTPRNIVSCCSISVVFNRQNYQQAYKIIRQIGSVSGFVGFFSIINGNIERM